MIFSYIRILLCLSFLNHTVFTRKVVVKTPTSVNVSYLQVQSIDLSYKYQMAISCHFLKKRTIHQLLKYQLYLMIWNDVQIFKTSSIGCDRRREYSTETIWRHNLYQKECL